MKYDFPMIVPIAIERIFNKIGFVWSSVRTCVLCIIWGVRRGGPLVFQGPTIIRTRHRGDVVLGKGVRLVSRLRSNLVGIQNPTIISTLHGGRLVVGEHTGMTSPVISSKSLITIGRRVMVGGNVRIFDHDFHSLNPRQRGTAEDRLNIRTKPIEIGDDCFIGTNAIILKGTKLGARTIVAAGSVVCGLVVPPDSLVRGNPATVVGRS